MKTLKIALDWTPNVNHIGIIIAKELGFYEALGIDTVILDPSSDNYATTPGKKLALGEVDFAIAPFETVISLNNKSNPVDAVAVFAILQEDISSIASLQSSNITEPKILDNKTYASYKARYEDHIVKKMIANDGGNGTIKITYPDKLGIWNTLLQGKADATWIFNNWEGIEAEEKEIALNKFSMTDFGIPYCYSPIIITKKSAIEKQKKAYQNFIKATKQGYLYVENNKIEANKILSKHLTNYDRKNINLSKAIDLTVPLIGNEETCGLMKPKRVSDFLNWIVNNRLEDKKILNQSLYSNELTE